LEVGPLAAELPVPAAWPSDAFVAAYIGHGSLQEQPETLELLEVVAGSIRIPAAAGPRVVFTAVSRLTGQNVKRAAHGAEGPVFDHYSLAATRSHIAHVAGPLLEAAGAELLGSVFCDSLEVYGADWTPDAVAEFTRRRGYDPLPELYLLEVEGAGAPRFRRDMYRTLTELYEQNFLVPLQRWAAGHGVPFRIQGYGEPPASVSSYRFADMFEGEGWGWKEVTQTRWASSAAHLYGKPVFSSEIWTWVHSPSFRATPLDLKGEAHEHLLLGINHFIGHGWPYSPGLEGAPGIGWMFYASGALDDRNPWWPAMPELTRYLHRLAWLMRQGEPLADVALYAPTSDAYAAMHSGGGSLIDLWRTTRERIGEAVPRVIRESGLDFDLIDDDALDITPPERYSVVILPNVDHLPDAAVGWLGAVEAAGGTVIAVGSDPRGGSSLTPDRLADALRDAVLGPVLLPASPEVGLTRRRVGDADIHFLANTAAEPQSFELIFREPRAIAERWDASTGAVTGRVLGADRIQVQLAAYEAMLLVASDSPHQLPAVISAVYGTRIPLNGFWTVNFGNAPTAVELPHHWEDDPGRAAYSGSARYTTTIEVSGRSGPSWRAWLDFGPAVPLEARPDEAEGIRGRSFRAKVTPPIGEIAVVTVNGAEVGVVWSSPYILDVGAHLVDGTNAIEITVFNTAANGLAADGSVAEWAAASEARWGRRFRMQELHRAADGVSSGLLAVPTLVLGG
ncbi:MAG: hypothetical protein M3N46_11600, partial [Actinomycetota bacterium]|nr:hypothetical protein [Actinomycetota bacterium]